ncbi:MAG: anti-sigma-I factor RsgI family protein, partial [Bacillota bacterium]
FGLTLFRQTALPPAAAYVSLDINPSLEMAVNKDMQVIDVSFFNDDGVDLVQEADLEGENLYEALNTLVRKAIDRHYIKPDQKNLMISTVTAASADTTELNPVKLQQALESAIAAGGFTGEVRVYQVAAEVRTMAEQNGLSPGKFILYEQAKETGAKVTVQEIKQNSIRELVDIYKIKLLPNQKKIIIQKLDNNGRPRVLIEENGKTVPGAAHDKNGGSRDDDDEDEDNDEDDKEKGKNEKSGGPQIKKGDRIKVKIDDKEDKENNEDKEVRQRDKEDKDKEVEKRPDSGNDINPADRQQERDQDGDEAEDDDNDGDPSENAKKGGVD